MRHKVMGLMCVGMAAACSGGEGSEGQKEAYASVSAELTIGSAELKNRRQTVLWSGSVGPEDAPIGGEPTECQTAECERFDLEVDLPPHTFGHPNRPGGVQFAIRWFGDPGPHQLPPGVPGCCGEFDALNIYVYKDGVRVAASEGIIATSASAFLPDAPNGMYQIYVASDPSYNLNPSVAYEALAEVEYLPRVHPARPLLPDLEFRSARTVTFDTPSFPLFEPDPAPGESCFQSEKIEDGAEVCLRFDQVIANAGEAPAEIRFALPQTGAPEDGDIGPVDQRIFYSDGSVEDRDGGEWEFHGIHQHYHYTSFAEAALWKSNHKAKRFGHAPARVSEKVSFCMVDVEIDAWAEKGDGPRRYFAPDCLFPTESDGSFDYIVQGITNGWNDIYEWYLPDQYIEVSGLQDGYYLLESCADPDGVLKEASEDNNCVTNHLWIEGVGTPGQFVENFGAVKVKRQKRHHHHHHGRRCNRFHHHRGGWGDRG